ncbi:C-terminal binding protein [Leucobacter albus]|uniref:C-terminal binding protein n=1 Tax=Leucobacter albus TaxID=272210 RepID=A0ABW3TRD6_9MICO
MSRPLAVYSDIVGTDPAPGVAALEAAGWEVRVAGSENPATIAAVAPDAQALLIGYSPVGVEMLDALPALRIVATQSVGTDMVDLAACAARGISVSNVPASATEEVAVHALAMALSLVRGLPQFDRSTRAGEWNPGAADALARPSALTVGVLGLGRIGRRFAGLAAPIFGEVVGYDPADFAVPGLERLGLEAVLRRADVLSLHLPLLPETSRLLDAQRLALLPAGARIVNVARGALIDKAALLDALDSGRLAGAALDVLEVEPPDPGDALLRHPRVLASPHVAFLSPQSEIDYVVHQAENVIAVGSSGSPLSPVFAPAAA